MHYGSFHRNIIVTLLSRKFAGVSLLAIFLFFLEKTEPDLTKMTTVVCFHCSLEVALTTFTGVKALKTKFYIANKFLLLLLLSRVTHL